ncbi:rRNA methyltransferase 3, mitochondrial isoform X1 [Neophocaena asiaeorientalis asiaeorientalis]|uniref:rRNA methyltransferase 3, mitochondrial isoform X1 n=4 Tax=Phocoenidae TaxID=9740 RepID=A0A341AQH2_NEOAA|nr:rRNA methyltransferase 3, mitochondrial isoform X1 [Neophocaena asiaeorientalis asiaeorientalis]XP_032472308.1 rRNA methyltransferase 3, mitochondrial isoform X1 [Phocoena sinus]XP_032472311.1 rRNA methyltransferase 3, mitochondrial isoform X1 [Phocoena sinus]
MAVLRERACWATRQLLPVVRTWELDARRWVRALRRSPVKVVFPSGQVVERKPGPGKEPRKAAAEASPREQRLKQSRQVPPSQTPSTWEESGLRYDKAFPGDKRLSSVMTVVKSRQFREKQGKILLEGRRLIADALKAGAVPKVFFFSRLEYIKELPIEKLKGVSLIKVKFEDVKDWSDLVTPQGIMGIFAKPDHVKMTYPESQLLHTLPILLICDNLRDPGNLGTILRSAAGAGCSKVLLTKGCVDAWEPKVLRAGMGAHFQVPIINNVDWEAVPNYLPNDTRVYVADNCGLYTQAQAQMSNKASDYGWVCDRRPLKFHKYEEEEENLESAASKGWLPELEVQSYDSDWTEAPAAVVIGGETSGVSLESLQLAESTGGGRLLIPIVPGVDSLNSAMAASILLFEGRRQLRVRAEHLSRDGSYH